MRLFIAAAVAYGILATVLVVFAGLYEQAREQHKDAQARVERLQRERAADRRLWQNAGEPDLSLAGNVMVVCVTQGSRLVNGKRVPLDLNKAPAVGDAYRRVCNGVKNETEQGGPVG